MQLRGIGDGFLELFRCVKDWQAHPYHFVDDLEVTRIEKIREGDTTQWRKLREKYWIFTLKTLTPNGLNLQ